MSNYLGRQPKVGNFVKLDAITVVNGQATYTMQRNSVNFTDYDNEFQFLVSLNGILQSPKTSFTCSGHQITFASNLATGDVIDFITVLGDVLNIGTCSDNTVSLAKLTATGTKDATTFLRGDNTFATPSVALTLLHTDESSTAVSEVDFSSYVSSSYDDYILHWSSTCATDDTTLRLRFFSSGSVITGSSAYGHAQLRLDAGTYVTHSSNADSAINLTEPIGQGNQSTETLEGVMNFTNLNSTSFSSACFFKFDVEGTTGAHLNCSGSGKLLDGTTACDGFKVYYASGNITSYEYRLYGLKNT
jgi:hypothetical protein